ncbi:MAG: lysine biosynthesis protein LysW [Chloroflexota bacterium]
MNKVECIECAAEVEVPSDAIVGELLICEECDAELEVTALIPLTIALAPEVEEDWGE